jgi:hypothetical protein
MTHLGGCLCGRVRYRITAALGALVYCHCAQCRKAQGVAFGANAPIPLSQFELVSGNEILAAFRGSSDKTRYFCANCGSAMYSYVDGAATVRIRVGTLDPGIDVVPSAHIFTASKAPWVTIQDELDQYVEREPGRA